MTEDGDNRTPSTFEIDNCRRIVLSAIEKYKPKIIILLGGVAVYSIIGHRWKKELGTISKWRGWTIPDQDFKAWICPVYHPSFVERSKQNKYGEPIENPVEEVIWKQDLQNAFACLKKEFPIHQEPEIEIIEDLTELEYWKLGQTKVHITPRRIVFDYETTGLKPHAPGHRIVCASIAASENHAYVFMMPETRKERKPFIDLLTDELIEKIAQNMKFEHSWSKKKLRVEVKGWKLDTMLVTHCLDNRPGVTGLKFQIYVQFGIVDYDSEIAPYLQAIDPTNANSLNRIDELLALPGGKEKLLKYCGYDSVYEFRLAKLQEKIIENAELPF